MISFDLLATCTRRPDESSHGLYLLLDHLALMDLCQLDISLATKHMLRMPHA
jgi:hypothetical protein